MKKLTSNSNLVATNFALVNTPVPEKKSVHTETDCIFCKILRGELPCTKIFEDDHTLAFLNINPEKPGHTLVIPKTHVRNLIDCPLDILNQTMAAVQTVAKKHSCVKIIQNNEKPIQEIFHLHFHVIPFCE